MPAVVGTGMATKIIRSGMRIRVDGSTGVITISR
jgi:pyruvate,water dikinase